MKPMNVAACLKPIRQANLTDEIVKQIVDLILDQKLRPGDKLPSERELVEMLGVGRSSLREALKVLAVIGVIRVSRGNGTSVGEGDLSRLTLPLSAGLLIGEHARKEIIEARWVIEVELAAMAAERASEEEIAEIGRKVESLRSLQTNPAEYLRGDLEFHLAIARAAHNHLLYNVYQRLRRILRELIARVVVVDDAEHMPGAFQSHVPIFEAIRARDPKAARRAMTAHSDRFERVLRGVDPDSPDQGDVTAEGRSN